VDWVVAIAGLDLQVEAGEAVAFLGPNGAGKSTTIKMLTGTLTPTAGEATVCGLVSWRQREALARRIGVLFGQRSQMWLHLPVVDTFNLLASIYDVEWHDYRRRRDELVERFELQELLDVPVRKLSLGQRMRCELAAALLHRPAVLFLDEPTIGLDPLAKATVRDLIRQVNAQEGVTVFLTSHDAGDVERVCRRAILIDRGRLLLDQPVDALHRLIPQRRRITVHLASPWRGIVVPGVQVQHLSTHRVTLEVATGEAAVDVVVAELLRRHAVEDLRVEAPPLEDVIAELYRRGVALEGEGRGPHV
jgi:ABC-2 type transport system ATP-binding protein